MKTSVTTKQKDIVRNWHLFNVKDQILGRVATQIAYQLMGKSKPYFVRHLDCGDYVVVINAKAVATSGKKEVKKIYSRYSGYPGGMKTMTLGEMRVKHPEDIIMHAVSGMLPNNKLRASMLTRLYVYAAEEHPYKDKFNK